MLAPLQGDMKPPTFIRCLQNSDGTINKAAWKQIQHQRAWAQLKKEVASLPKVGGR